jgi:hypothetical protein
MATRPTGKTNRQERRRHLRPARSRQRGTSRRNAGAVPRTPSTGRRSPSSSSTGRSSSLDRLGADIRAASGVAISRAHVIRALIDALSESDLDLTGTRSEADLKAILTARLGRYRV